MNRLTYLWKQIDEYKQACLRIRKCNSYTITNELIKNELNEGETRKELAIYTAETILRRFMYNVGIRAERVYTDDNKLIFELEPGGIPELLKEMLRKSGK